MAPILVAVGAAVAAAIAWALSQNSANSPKQLPAHDDIPGGSGGSPTYGNTGEELDAKDAAAKAAGAKMPGVTTVPKEALPPGVSTTPPSVVIDEAFNEAVAIAIAKHDSAALMSLAQQAEDRGFLDIARSLRAEAARITMGAPPPTPPGPDKPSPATIHNTYTVKAGDTGSSIAKAFTGNPNRWTELVAANPETKDAKYGLKANPGKVLQLPVSWPAHAITSAPAPLAVPVVQSTPTGNTYTVKAGDTGSSIAKAFTGNPNRWTELVAVNPETKDVKYGLKANPGKVLKLPISWPAHAASNVPLPVSVSPVVQSTPTGNTYTVKAGDTGSSIAKAFTGNANRWTELVAANPETKDATYGLKAYPGKVLKLPASWPRTPSGNTMSIQPVQQPVQTIAVPEMVIAPTTAKPTTYTVKAGDTGSSIAKAFTGNANRWTELVAANPETKDAKYGLKAYPGKVLKLPISWQ